MHYRSYKSKVLKFLIVFSFLALVLGAAGFGQSPVMAYGEDGLAPLILDVDDPIEDHYIVVYKEMDPGGVAAASAVDTAAIEAAGGEVTFVYDTALQGFAAYLPPAALELVRQNPLVEYVIIDGMVHLDDDQTGAGDEGAETDVVQDNATWGLDRIDQRTLPLNRSYTYDTAAAIVHAYILDTGIRSTHVEFDGRATKDFDAISDGQNGNDCNGHGTHVAGTIGSTTYGVAKKVHLHAVRVLDCSGSGSWSQVISGVNWVANNAKKPAVANMSLGGSAYDALDTAVTNAILKGITFVVSAGNEDINACLKSPARTPRAITVASITGSDYRSWFSNYGSCVDLFAPGSYITSTYYLSNTSTTRMSGTSMASPHVAGVAALYLAQNPAATPNQVTNAILTKATPNVVEDVKDSPNKLLFSQVNPNTVPITKTPTGFITDRTPTYTWTAVAGATQYRFQLRSGTVIYNKVVGSDACAGALCSSTPTNVLAFGKYNWRVQALVKDEWQNWSNLHAFELIDYPIPVSPSGEITDSTPKYIWRIVPEATQYRLQLMRGDTVEYIEYLNAGDCGVSCVLIPANRLKDANYQWQAQAMVNGVWLSWSDLMPFQMRAGFVSDFNGDKAGWKNIVGNWPILQDQYLVSAGGVDFSNSVQYFISYHTFNFEAVIKRVGDPSSANALYVRGQPTPIASDGSWYSGYYFAYSNDEMFSVWEFSNGSYTILQPWTYSPAIHPDAFNILRVVGNGPNLKFMINGALVWWGTDDSFTIGYPGIAFYSPYSPGNRLLVNWARLATVDPVYIGLDPNEQVESGQIVVGGDSPFVSPDFDPVNIQ